MELEKRDERFKDVKKPRNRVDKYKSLRKKKRKGFHGTGRYTQNLQTPSNVEENTQAADLTEAVSQPPFALEVTSLTSNNNQYATNSTKTNETVSVMHKKQQHKQTFSPVKCQTRKRKRESSLFSPDSVTPITGSGYKIIESGQFNSLISASCCSICKNNTLELRQNNKRRKGMCETIMLYCNHCKVTLKSVQTSQSVETENKRSQLVDINLRSVMAATAAGGGLASLRRFCTNFNFPEPVTANSYNNYLRHLESHAISNCDQSMHNAAKELRQNLLKNNEPDNGQILNTAVSVDGSWQKRYGHNSLNGLVYIISIETGCVLDYVVKTKVCHVCKSNVNADDKWRKEHAKVCCINHTKVNICDNLRRGLLREQKTRLSQAAKKVTDKYKRRRQDLRQQRKSKKKKDTSYQAGSFSTSAVPDDLLPHPKKVAPSSPTKSKLYSETTCNVTDRTVDIVFVNDTDVEFIQSKNILIGSFYLGRF